MVSWKELKCAGDFFKSYVLSCWNSQFKCNLVNYQVNHNCKHQIMHLENNWDGSRVASKFSTKNQFVCKVDLCLRYKAFVGLPDVVHCEWVSYVVPQLSYVFKKHGDKNSEWCPMAKWSYIFVRSEMTSIQACWYISLILLLGNKRRIVTSSRPA